MNNNRGFTMIELLMAIVLVAILNAVALPAYLDFRKEAKIAALQQSLAMMRTSIKLQTQQAILRCGASYASNWRTEGGNTFFVALGPAAYLNDITIAEGFPLYKICTTAQITNPSERKFWSISSSAYAHTYSITGEDLGADGELPTNPFAPTPGIHTEVIGFSSDVQTHGGACGTVAFVNGLGQAVSWLYDNETGQIFAGTNTPGVNECSF